MRTARAGLAVQPHFGYRRFKRFQIYLADSDNAAVRSITSATGPKDELPAYSLITKRTDPAEFRDRQPARWPYDPPEAKRDIAGTLGEIRGEIVDETSQAWFHNGLDIAGGYGEKARFIRGETVLNPASTDNFGTLRELFAAVDRISIFGSAAIIKPSPRRQPFSFDADMKHVRVRRGTKFAAGDVIGTLNR